MIAVSRRWAKVRPAQAWSSQVGEVEEHLAGKGVVSRVQGRELAHQLEDVSVAGNPSSRTRRATAVSSGVGRFLAGIHRR